MPDAVVDIIQMPADKDQGCFDRHQKFDMILKQAVDIPLTVETPVHDHLHVGKAEHVQIREKMPYRFHIGDVSRQFAVIKGKIGLLAEEHQKIQLCQAVVLFVFAVSHLGQLRRITGDRRAVIGPELPFRPASALPAEKTLPCLVGNRSKQLAAALGRDVLPVGMPMQKGPFFKPEQGRRIFQDQIIGKRHNLFITPRKTMLQIFSDTQFITNGVKQIGGTIKTPLHHHSRNRSALPAGLFHLPLPASPISLFNGSGLFVDPADQGSFGPGLLLLFIPPGFGAVGIGDARTFVFLMNNSCHKPSLIVMYKLTHNEHHGKCYFILISIFTIYYARFQRRSGPRKLDSGLV